MSIFSKVGEIVGAVAPVLGTVLGGPLGGIGGFILSKALGTAPDPEALEKLITETPGTLDKVKEVEQANLPLLEQIKAQQNMVALQEETKQQQSVNETMRKEYETEDRFKTYWRPAFGYVVGLTWFLQTVSTCFVMIYMSFSNNPNAPGLLKSVISMIEYLSIWWGFALSVLGIQIRQRTKEKQGIIDDKSIIGLLIDKLKR